MSAVYAPPIRNTKLVADIRSALSVVLALSAPIVPQHKMETLLAIVMVRSVVLSDARFVANLSNTIKFYI
jgi:hypothetical protein